MKVSISEEFEPSFDGDSVITGFTVSGRFLEHQGEEYKQQHECKGPFTRVVVE